MSDAIPYNGKFGKYVGEGHLDYRGGCIECDNPTGEYHKEGCSEAHRNLNQPRFRGAFALDELLIIEELSGVRFQGRHWGGYGDAPTDQEREAGVPNPNARRYMPPPTRTLQEAIDLVKAHFADRRPAQDARTSTSAIRTWARKRGLPVSQRGRVSQAIRAQFLDSLAEIRRIDTDKS